MRKWFASPRARLFAGATLISLSPVWVRLADVSPTVSGVYRLVFGGIALGVVLLVTGRRLDLGRRTWGLLVIASVFLALDLWFWHRSILYIGPGLSTLLANFQVFVMMLAGIVMLRRLPPRRQLLAVPLALAGLTMIVGLDWSALSPDYRAGVALGLATAVVYAGYLLSLRASRAGSSHALPVREVLVVSVITSVMLGATTLLEGESLAIPTWRDAGWLITYGFVSHCAGWLFITSSLPQVSPTDAGLALLLQPALSYVWEILFFARAITVVEIAGAAVALFAIWLGSRGSSDQPQGAGQ